MFGLLKFFSVYVITNYFLGIDFRKCTKKFLRSSSYSHLKIVVNFSSPKFVFKN